MIPCTRAPSRHRQRSGRAAQCSTQCHAHPLQMPRPRSWTRPGPDVAVSICCFRMASTDLDATRKPCPPPLVAHDCGYPLSRYTCRATRVAADFLDFIAFCRCSTGVALHPPKSWCRTSPPPFPGGVAPKFGSEKVSRYTGVSQVQLRVSRYTVQLSPPPHPPTLLENPVTSLNKESRRFLLGDKSIWSLACFFT